MEYKSFSYEETFNIAFQIAEKAQAQEVFCLTGDLGVGKTVFSKGFAKGLGVNEEITSPTFTLMNEYKGRYKLYHFDVYRLSCAEETEELGILEYFYDSNAVSLVEWAEIIKGVIPINATWITISKDLNESDDFRLIKIVGGLK